MLAFFGYSHVQSCCMQLNIDISEQLIVKKPCSYSHIDAMYLFPRFEQAENLICEC